MITVFGRDFYAPPPGCNYSGYSAIFDGVNQYVEANDANHYMGIGSLYTGQGNNKVVISVWVKQDWTYSTVGNGTKFMLTQNATGPNGGNVDQFFRLAYGAKNSSGANLNKLYVTYRGDGTSNQIERVYDLHANTSVTGSSGAGDWWVGDNTNIITNMNGFVHLCAILDLPEFGQPFGFGGIDTYWNGNLLGNSTYNVAGSAQNDTNSVYAYLGANISNTTGFFHGKLDELQVLSDRFGMTTSFLSSYGLSSNQDIATFLWNGGCPIDLTTHSNSANWNYYNYRFENNWDSEGTSPYSMTSINGATFSTDHA